MEKQNIILGYPNRADSAALSGGSWEASLPVSNVADRELWKAARTTDANLSSSKFTCDLGANKLLRCFALCNHNMGRYARWRVKVGSSPGGSEVWDSGWVNVWGMVFDALVEWESVTWWSGISGDEYYRSPYPAIIISDDFYTARYVSVEIDDTGNADGYVQAGRFFAGGGLQPNINANRSLSDSWNDLSDVGDRSESGSVWAVKRRRLREVSFVLQCITTSEAAYIHEMQRLLGTVEEVLYVPYPDDLGETQRYGFLGRLSELSAIEYPYPLTRGTAFRIEELG